MIPIVTNGPQKQPGLFLSGHQRVQTVRSILELKLRYFCLLFSSFLSHNHMVQWKKWDGPQDFCFLSSLGNLPLNLDDGRKEAETFRLSKKKRLPPIFGSWLSHLYGGLADEVFREDWPLTRLADVCKCYSNKQKAKKWKVLNAPVSRVKNKSSSSSNMNLNIFLLSSWYSKQRWRRLRHLAQSTKHLYNDRAVGRVRHRCRESNW